MGWGGTRGAVGEVRGCCVTQTELNSHPLWHQSTLPSAAPGGPETIARTHLALGLLVACTAGGKGLTTHYRKAVRASKILTSLRARISSVRRTQAGRADHSLLPCSGVSVQEERTDHALTVSLQSPRVPRGRRDCLAVLKEEWSLIRTVCL